MKKTTGNNGDWFVLWMTVLLILILGASAVCGYLALRQNAPVTEYGKRMQRL